MLEVTGGIAGPLELLEVSKEETRDTIFVPGLEEDRAEDSSADRKPQPVAVEATSKKGGAWFPGPENAVIHWPRFEELLIEELD